MKPVRHGNVSAMETSQRIVQTSSRCVMWFISIVACISASSCTCNPPVDRNGKLPSDIVREFVEDVEAKNYEAAKNLWYGNSKRITGPADFEKFCLRYSTIDLNNCNISRAMRGKSGFYMVHIDWEHGIEMQHSSLGLKIVDGEWRIERGYYW